MSEQVIRFGVVGLGHGAAHLRALSRIAGCSVTAVCDIDGELAQSVAATLEDTRVHSSVDDLLNDAIDAIDIATPDHMHGEHAIAALSAGKSVLSDVGQPNAMCRYVKRWGRDYLAIDLALAGARELTVSVHGSEAH